MGRGGEAASREGALKTGKEEPADAKDTSVCQGAVLWVWRPLGRWGVFVSTRACVCAHVCIRGLL